MKADIITIGDEILIGQVIDTNSAFIGYELNKNGIYVRRIHSIADIEIDIINTLDNSLQESDLIIITGGLGPTSDDITKYTLTKYFGGKLVSNQTILGNIRTSFATRNWRLTERNKKQAEIPDNCQVLHNFNGTAPGMIFRKDSKIIVSLPGVPFEMKALLTEQVIPIVLKEFELPVRIHKTVMIAGISESFLADKLEEWEESLSPDIKVAYLPSPGQLRLRISISGEKKTLLDEKLNNEVNYVIRLIGRDNVFGIDEVTLETVIGRMLRENKFTLSVAESCTGGNIAHMITTVPGSSAYFKGSVTAYANEIKSSLLEVPEHVIKKYGSVSRETVELMAKGIKKLMGTDFAIATSGIAGPDGGTPEKPVGTSWIAVASPQRVVSDIFLMGEDRGRNITKASLAGLNMLRNEIRNIIENSE
jgi:nicotinamide-nucleotide amidase